MIILQFSSSGGVGSHLIEWFTWSDYAHVDVVLPSGELLGARIDGGVKIRPANYKPFVKVARFGITLPPETEDRIYAFLRRQVGKPYDYSAILGLPFRRDWHHVEQWFCSELVAAAFEQAGSPLVRELTSRITPRDLMLSPLLQPLNHAAMLLKERLCA
jgi:uncharacterized protein YycO